MLAKKLMSGTILLNAAQNAGAIIKTLDDASYWIIEIVF